MCLGDDLDEVYLLPDPSLCIDREWMAVSYFKEWRDDPRDALPDSEAKCTPASVLCVDPSGCTKHGFYIYR